jgi:hypothetical protein
MKDILVFFEISIEWGNVLVLRNTFMGRGPIFCDHTLYCLEHLYGFGRISSLLAHRNFSKIIAFLDSSWYVDSESMICFERSLLVDEKFEFKV